MRELYELSDGSLQLVYSDGDGYRASIEAVDVRPLPPEREPAWAPLVERFESAL